MNRSPQILAALACCAAPLLVGAAKPAAAAFVPALAYKYGSQELRLSNAEGSQAVLLVRSPRGSAPLWLSIAPISRRQVAYIEDYGSGSRAVRLVSWTQQTTGGPLTVTVDPQPLFTLTGADDVVLSALDYSPDGTRLAVLASDQVGRTELRFLDTATRAQVGETVSLSRLASTLSWRSYDDSILLRGTQGMSSFKDGVETPLFGGNQPTDFDTFNGTTPDVILPYSGSAPGGTTQRWDGTTISGGAPALTPLVDGIGWSVSCDNSRMIYTDFSLRKASYNLVFATGERALFSKDSSIQRMEYPGTCG